MGLQRSRLTVPPQARFGLLATALWLAAVPAYAAASDCRPVALHVAGTGERVVGAEDIAIDPMTATAYVAAYDRRKVDAERRDGAVATTGGIYALPIADLAEGNAATVADLTATLHQRRDFRPHGIDLYRDGDGRATLFAINRAFTNSEDGPESDVAVEIFDVTADGLVHRGYAGTLRDPELCSPNDIAAAGHDSFFVTNDHGACAGFGRMIEDAAALDRAYVLHYDGAVFRRVAEGLGFANGIAIGPSGARLYVAATRDRSLEIYDLPVDDTAATASPVSRVELAAAPDNLSWGPDGALYVGAHPNLLSYAAFRGGWLGRDTAPSRALRIDPDGATATEIYADDGEQLSGATVAAVHGDTLLLGSAYDEHLVVCRLEAAR